MARQSLYQSQLPEQGPGSLCLTFCSTVFSSEWICIWAFLRLAWKASVSPWALLRTWAISSFALEGQKQTQARPGPATSWLGLPPRMGIWNSLLELFFCMGLQCLVPLAFLFNLHYVFLNTFLQ